MDERSSVDASNTIHNLAGDIPEAPRFPKRFVHWPAGAPFSPTSLRAAAAAASEEKSVQIPDPLDLKPWRFQSVHLLRPRAPWPRPILPGPSAPVSERVRCRGGSLASPPADPSPFAIRLGWSRLQPVICKDIRAVLNLCSVMIKEIIEKPIGLSLKAKEIGNNPACIHCQAKGAVLCATCSGSGLYIDSILESQGIIVKVRCL
ncbi:hypothetical protein Taro_037479, partial [Colocasia esculenta]|nr:hypothetical protein [Colocasia esculenta]